MPERRVLALQLAPQPRVPVRVGVDTRVQLVVIGDTEARKGGLEVDVHVEH
jgi:hypothetical protein